MAANYKDGPFSILPNASILFNYLAKSKKHKRFEATGDDKVPEVTQTHLVHTDL